MNPWRSSLLGGLAYSAAFAVWLTAGLRPGPAALDLAYAHQALLWTQAAALGLLLPAVAPVDRPRGDFPAPVLLIAVPWPILTLFWLAGGVPASALIGDQLGLIAWALALGAGWRLLGRALDRPDAARSALQAAALLTPLLVLPHASGLLP